MAAGLGFKTFTTGEVLTAADTNGYLMQGVLVFATSAARDAAITSPQEGQFAYLKDTNVTTYYTGSVWANLDTTGMTNPMTTTGDSIYSSSGSTPARLGIGSTGQVLTVAAGLPSWATPAAGGMTQLATGTVSGTTTTISSISGSYKHLYLRVLGAQIASASEPAFVLNGTTGTAYQVKRGETDSTTWQNTASGISFRPTGQGYQTSANSSLLTLLIEDYALTGSKNLTGKFASSNGGGVGFGTNYAITAAITSIGITSLAGVSNITVGTYTLFGVS